jgi:alcohol dehydrogenase class IV
MALAALEAGMAFNNSSVTIVHGMSRPMGALFHVPHGISNAMLLNVCLDYAKEGAADRFAHIAVKCGLGKPEDSSREAADKLMERVGMLLREIQIPTLAEYGIPKEDFMRAIPKMSEDAMASGSPSNTRRDVTVQEVEALYRKLWKREEM